MTIAFDLDGTITANPKLFGALAGAFEMGGHRVLVLTAAAGELSPDKRPSEVRLRLARLGLPAIEIICCESNQKPLICQKLAIDVLIDDTIFPHMKHTLQLVPVALP